MSRRPLVFFFFFLFLVLVVPCLSHGGGGDHDDDDAPHAKSTDLKSKSLISVKIACLVIIFVLTFISGVSPYFLKWSQGFLVLGTQFAGGVFLATALMHFLPDADETFRDLLTKEGESEPSPAYPFAFMLACAGYMLTMLADSVIAHVYSKTPSKDVEELQGEEKPNQGSGIGDSILLIVALCFHSVFEGIAIGISESKADAWRALWTITLHKIFAAIAMGIALLRMIPDRPLFSTIIYSFAFAISSPIGVGIGIVIDATTQGTVADWIFAVSMSLACGVFVYVSVNHLLAKGYIPNKKVNVDQPSFKFLAVLSGVVVIAIVMIWDT
ncbi:Zinc transporter 11 [Raphanus sativus]|uniref:Zinc transporter 11 n=1 Tax=Raphanus sativus TaxID=3726 RepID=A0A6J0KT45_RAPSA|nr:zinc transporter 11 [Raphanus sativus]KAJ4881958.1 Zinc transporter 11 [Raphanus sativus]